MKTQWMAVAVISAAFAAGCGDKSAENAQNSPQNEGTTVTVPPETGGQSNLQPAPAEQPAVSSNRDATAKPNNSPVGTTSRPRAAAAPRDDRPADPIPSTASRVAAAPAPHPTPVVRYVTIPAG